MKLNPKMAVRERVERKSGNISWRTLRSFAAIATGFLLAGTVAQAQVNSGSNGSNGSDGAFQSATTIPAH